MSIFSNLQDIRDGMDVNGDDNVSEEQTKRMQALLNRDAPTYGWKRLSDVEDVDWFRMQTEAMNNTEDKNSTAPKTTKTYPIPDGLATQYHGAGWALVAVAGGHLVKLVYLADVSPAFEKMMGNPGADAHGAFFARQALSLPDVGPTIRELQALGEISVGMLSGWEFLEL